MMLSRPLLMMPMMLTTLRKRTSDGRCAERSCFEDKKKKGERQTSSRFTLTVLYCHIPTSRKHLLYAAQVISWCCLVTSGCNSDSQQRVVQLGRQLSKCSPQKSLWNALLYTLIFRSMALQSGMSTLLKLESLTDYLPTAAHGG
jgi:hypothetical protein